MYESAKCGSKILFGSYKQDPSKGKEPIGWIVLKKENNRILVISEKALDCVAYNSKWTSVTWETCTLRTWLNETFLKEAFTKEEQSKIECTHVPSEASPYYDTTPGNSTTDQLWILSIQEAKEYFPSNEARCCEATATALAKGVEAEGISWWLRVPGLAQSSAAYVDGDGSVYYYGGLVYFDARCVRPAMWITL